MMNITSRRRPSLAELSKKSSEEGFTILEVIIVLALILLIFMMALPTISSSFKTSLNSTTRDLASVVAEAYNATVISGKVYRVAFDLKENQYWVESGTLGFLLDTEESLDKERTKKRFSKDTDKKPKSEFALDKGISRKKRSLPRGVIFEDVMTEQSKNPLKEGIAYAHFFPHGLTEQTIIHIKDQSDHHASLVITSVIGQIDMYDRYIKKEEAFKNE